MSNNVIVNPWPGGFSNVIMSYEIALAVAIITQRTFIVPPTSWCVLIDEKHAPKETWQNIWDIYDKENAKKIYQTVELLDCVNLQPYIKTQTDNYSWLEPLPSNIGTEVSSLCDSTLCLYNSQQLKDTNDFSLFSNQRPTKDIHTDVEFLTVHAFGHFWYNVYASSKQSRNLVKKTVDNYFKYKEVYYQISREFVKTVLGTFNSLHIRSPWQLNYDDGYEGVVNVKDKPEKLLQQVEQLLNTDTPIYISTDITNKSFFDVLGKKYKLFFLEDVITTLKLDLSPLEKIVIDQIIASMAYKFYGSYYSTFTKRINILRGIQGKQADDYMGFNKIIPKPNWETSALPWTLENRHWNWYDSSHPQWTME